MLKRNEDLSRIMSNPVEAAEKAIRKGAEHAGRITSTAKKAYHAAAGGKGPGDYTLSHGGTTYKRTNVDSPGEHLKFAYAKHKDKLKKAAPVAAGAAIGAAAHRAHVKRRAKQFMKNDENLVTRASLLLEETKEQKVIRVPKKPTSNLPTALAVGLPAAGVLAIRHGPKALKALSKHLKSVKDSETRKDITNAVKRKYGINANYNPPTGRAQRILNEIDPLTGAALAGGALLYGHHKDKMRTHPLEVKKKKARQVASRERGADAAHKKSMAKEAAMYHYGARL